MSGVVKIGTNIFKGDNKIFRINSPSNGFWLEKTIDIGTTASGVAVDTANRRILVAATNDLKVFDFDDYSLLSNHAFTGIVDVTVNEDFVCIVAGNTVKKLSKVNYSVISSFLISNYLSQVQLDKVGNRIFIAFYGVTSGYAGFLVYNYTTNTFVEKVQLSNYPNNCYGIAYDIATNKIFTSEGVGYGIVEVDYTNYTVGRTGNIANQATRITVSSKNDMVAYCSPASGTINIRRISNDVVLQNITGIRPSAVAFGLDAMVVVSNFYNRLYIYKK